MTPSTPVARKRNTSSGAGWNVLGFVFPVHPNPEVWRAVTQHLRPLPNLVLTGAGWLGQGARGEKDSGGEKCHQADSQNSHLHVCCPPNVS